MSQYGWWFCGAVVVLIGLLSAGSALTSRGYRFASGRIEGVIGVMGSGKSLFAVTKIILPAARSMSKKRGLYCGHTGRKVERIITNFEMDLPYPDVEVVYLNGSRIFDHLLELAGEWSEWNERKEVFEPKLHALVIIDEAHLFMPSAKLKLATKAAYVFSMARKMNAEIWWITQNEMKIHKRLRDDTSMIWRVGRSASLWTLITGPSKWFTARGYEPEKLHRLNSAPHDQRRYRLSKAAIACYNSFELIVPDAEADVSLDSLSARREPVLPLELVRTPSEKATSDAALSLDREATSDALEHDPTA